MLPKTILQPSAKTKPQITDSLNILDTHTEIINNRRIYIK